MKNELIAGEEKDPLLWNLAKKRASFRAHATTYVSVNAFLWILWAFGSREHLGESGIPWPVFSMAGWGIGLFFHFINAFVRQENSRVEKEYERLIQKRNN
jgi:hypothetical protein